MPLAARKIVPFRLAVAARPDHRRAMAGDQPSQPDGFAPPETFTRRAAEHWAYQPVKRVVPPAVKESGWVRNPIDRFILAELEKLGAAARARGGSRRLDPARHLRPDRPAPAARRGRRLPRATAGRTPTNGWSIACWPARSTASAGASTGSTWPTTPIPTASSSTPSGPTPGAIATGSSERSERRPSLRSLLDAPDRRR